MAIVRDALRYRLKDPDSAMVKLVGSPYPMVINKTMVTNGGAGWRICAEFS